MNHREKELLGPTIRAVIRHNAVAWWELKRQIFEGGFQMFYPAQDDFAEPAKRAVAGLALETQARLVSEWRSAQPSRASRSDSEILSAYARMVVDQVIKRARTATSRTGNW